MNKDVENISVAYGKIQNRNIIPIQEDVGLGFINKMKLNGISINRSNDSTAKVFYLDATNILSEAIEMTFEKRGGIIVFSTDVNAVYEQDKGFANKVKNWMHSKIQTMKNRLFANQKLTKVANKFEDVYAFSIGNFFKGRYKSSGGKTYDENSMSIEVIGIDSDTLLKLAEEIAREFNQQTVLVKDYQKNEIFLVNTKS